MYNVEFTLMFVDSENSFLLLSYFKRLHAVLFCSGLVLKLCYVFVSGICIRGSLRQL